MQEVGQDLGPRRGVQVQDTGSLGQLVTLTVPHSSSIHDVPIFSADLHKTLQLHHPLLLALSDQGLKHYQTLIDQLPED